MNELLAALAAAIVVAAPAIVLIVKALRATRQVLDNVEPTRQATERMDRRLEWFQSQLERTTTDQTRPRDSPK